MVSMKVKSLTEKLMLAVVCDVATQCWNWTGGVTGRGYGQLWFGTRTYRVHRLSYELFRGPIIASYEIHHLCGNAICCNPTHLVALTDLEHKRADPNWIGNRTHCKRGHPLSGDNLRIQGRANSAAQKRVCRTCVREKAKVRYVNTLFEARRRGREHGRKYYAATHVPKNNSRYRKVDH